MRPSRSASTGSRRQVHRQVEFDAGRGGARRAREAFGNEGPLPDPRLGQAAPARLVVGARHGGEVDAQRPGERPMRRQPLAAMQATRGDVGARAPRRCLHRPARAGRRVSGANPYNPLPMSLNVWPIVRIYKPTTTGGLRWNGPARRPLSAAGPAGRCPACGEGHLFRAFVKVADALREVRRAVPPSSRRRLPRLSDDRARRPHRRADRDVGRDRLQPDVLAARRDLGCRWSLGMAIGLLQPLKGADRRAAVAHGHARLRRGEACAAAKRLAEGVEQLRRSPRDRGRRAGRYRAAHAPSAD